MNSFRTVDNLNMVLWIGYGLENFRRFTTGLAVPIFEPWCLKNMHFILKLAIQVGMDLVTP